MRLPLPALCLMLALAATPALAADAKSGAPQPLGTFDNWQAFSYKSKGQPVCYMLLTAHLPNTKKMKRGPAHLMITHRPGENSKDVISYAAGYAFKPEEDVHVAAGGRNFGLFMQNDTAWSRDAATDSTIALALRANASVKITGTPKAKGAAPVTDTLTIKGANDAYQAISKACGYEVPPLPAPKAAEKTKPKAKTVTKTKKKHR